MFFCEFPVNPRSLTHASSRVPETHILATIRMPGIYTPPRQARIPHPYANTTAPPQRGRSNALMHGML